MKFALTLCFLALVPFRLAEYVRYEKYKVYRVTPKTERDVEVLRSFEKLSKHIDFWSEGPVLGNPADVMVPPSLQNAFKVTLKFTGIEFVEIIQDVEKIFQEERHRQIMAARTSSDEIDFKQYYRYDSIISYLQQLQRNYPTFVKVEYPGISSEGRQLPMIKISTGGNNKPVILIDAGIHAREWIAPAMALYIINQLVENPVNRLMIENVDWHIIPLLNPDGYEYSHLSDRLWRKTRSYGAACIGVDANRNFDFHWMEVGVSQNQCIEDYGGSAAMSEPEVQTLAKVVKEEASRIKLYLTFHSYGTYILYPWGYTSDLPENGDVLQRLGVEAANAIRAVGGTTYAIGSAANILYATAGSSSDWVKGIGGVELVYTIEFPGGGGSGFDPPTSAIIPTGEETFEGIKVYHNFIANLH